MATDRPPTAETVAVAKRDLKVGETIDALGGFTVYGMIESATDARSANHLPLGLAPGGVVTKDVEMGQTLTYDDVDLDDGSMIRQLRRLQDRDLG